MNHPDHHRRAYLKAMGIDVWVPRDSEDPVAGPAIDALADAEALELLDFDELRRAVSTCTRCELANTRTQTVFGVGDMNADWMIIGESPGAEEDRRGEPFVGAAGTMLGEILRSIGLQRKDVFIANILKCRPPNNRDPKPLEAAACRGFLERQISLVQPRIIVAVGKFAAQSLLSSSDPIGDIRGRPYEINGIPVVATYHPAYLLRSPGHKRDVWSDLCMAMSLAKEGAA